MCRITFFDVQSIIIVNFIWLDIFIVYDDNRTESEGETIYRNSMPTSFYFEDLLNDADGSQRFLMEHLGAGKLNVKNYTQKKEFKI